MVGQAYLIRLMAIAAVARALPLNINLGAYSPALVVGDGAIEFEGTQVERVVNGLQGAAVAGGNGVAQGAAVAPPVTQAAVLSEPATLPIPGSTKELDPREGGNGAVSKITARDIGGFDRALRYAEAALVKGPKVQLGTGAAGVGIIVDNNPQAAARPGTGIVAK